MRFDEKKISEFTDALASADAIPGGGGASALVGAVGIALGNMVGALTVGKKKYAAVEEEIKAAMTEGECLRRELLDMMDKDAEAFAPLLKAYRTPKDEPGRDEMVQKALVAACQAPIAVMRTVCKALDLIEEFAAKGTVVAISDAGVGAICCKAALQGAFLNVYTNTASMKDREYAEMMESEAQDMLDKYCDKADRIYDIVIDRIK